MTVVLTVTADAAVANAQNPSGSDRSTDFNTFFSGLGRQKIVEINGGYDTASGNGGYRTGLSSVLIPYGSSIQGTGRSAKIYADSGSNTPLFRLNTDNSGNLIESSGVGVGPGFGNTFFRDIYVSGKWITARDTSTIPVFDIGESVCIENVQILGLQTLAKSGPFYLDQLTIRNCSVSEQPAGINYAVELNNSQRSGDGLVIDQLHLTLTNDSITRPRALRLNNARGGQVTNGINGDHVFTSCIGLTFSGFHGENGKITWAGSTAISENNVYWMRTGSQFGVTPVNVVLVAGAGGVVMSNIHFRNETFIYHAVSTFAWDTVQNHISIAAGSASIKIQDCHCSLLFNGIDPSPSGKAGIRTGNIVFDKYSHFASSASTFSMDQWLIEGQHGAIGTFSGSTYTAPPGFEGGGSVVDPAFGNWNLPPATYHFRLVVYLDLPRKIGRITSNNISKYLTNVPGAGEGAFMLSLNIGRGAKMLRVYIGSADNYYDRYIDIPWVDGRYLVCEGDRIMGWAAQTRPAGPPDTVVVQPARYHLSPGDPTNSPTLALPDNAYGNVEVWNFATAMPNQGVWNKGDIVHWMTPTGGKRGHQRLTNGGSHILGTDWVELTL